MACIASVLLSSSLKMGVLDPRMILLSLRNRDLATVYPYFIKLNTRHIEFLEWQREMLKIGLCCRNSIPIDVSKWAVVEQSLSSFFFFKKETKGNFVCPSWFPFCLSDALLTWQAPVQGKLSLLLGSSCLIRASCADCPDATELGELKACVHADSVAQLVTQDALLAVVGQLEQVEARWWGGKSSTRFLFADGEKAPKDTAEGVSRVLDKRNAQLAQP